MKPRLAFVLLSTAFRAVPAMAADPAAVVAHYADMAAAEYGDSLQAARSLRMAVGALVAEPSEETLAQAREAWLAARVPYQQTEVYRFGNAIVDEWRAA